MITHAADGPPTFVEKFDPQDSDWIWLSWVNKLEGGSILTSTWILPPGWTEESGALVNQSVTDVDGTVYANSNGARFSTTHTTGKHRITNRVTLGANGRSIDRSVFVVVKEQ